MTVTLSQKVRKAVKTGEVTLDAALIGADLADELTAVLGVRGALKLGTCKEVGNPGEAEDGVTLFEGTPVNLRGIDSRKSGPRLRVAIVDAVANDTAPQIFLTPGNADGEAPEPAPEFTDSFEGNDLDYLFDEVRTGSSFVYASAAVAKLPSAQFTPQDRAFARGLNVDLRVRPGPGLVKSLVAALFEDGDGIGKEVAALLEEALRPLWTTDGEALFVETKACIARSDRHIGTYLYDPALPDPPQSIEELVTDYLVVLDAGDPDDADEKTGTSHPGQDADDLDGDESPLGVIFVTLNLPMQGATVSLGTASLTLEACALAFPLTAGAEAEAIISVGVGSGDTYIEARVGLLTGQTLLRLANTPTAEDALRTLFDLGGSSDHKDTSGLLTIDGLPREALRSLGSVQADAAWILMDPSGFAGSGASPISCAGLSLSMAKPITLIDKFCTFAPRARIRIDAPLLETRAVTAVLSGDLIVGDALKIDAELLLPDGIFAATAELKLSEAATSLRFGDTLPGTLQDATCDLTLAGDWGAGAFAVELILTGNADWTATIGTASVDLKKVVFGVEHVAGDGAMAPETSFHFSATMNIGVTKATPLTFSVNGGWEDGWYLEGGMDGTLDLSEVVQRLFPAAPEPKSKRGKPLKLADLWISADLRNGGKYALRGRTEGDWQPFDDINITVGIALLELRYETGAAGGNAETGAHIIGRLGLGDLHLGCSARKLASRDGWIISGGLVSGLNLAKLARDLDGLLGSDIAKRIPEDLTVTDLTLTCNTAANTFEFFLKTHTKINETDVQVELVIKTTRGEKVETKVGGTLRIGDLRVKGIFLSDEDARLFAGSLALDNAAGRVNLGATIGGMVGTTLPEMSVDLKSLLFLWRKAAQKTNGQAEPREAPGGDGVLFDMGLGAEIALDLSRTLPIGAALGIPRLSVRDIGLRYSSAPFATKVLGSVVAGAGDMFPENFGKADIAAGFQLSATLAAGQGAPLEFSIGAPPDRTTEPVAHPETSRRTASDPVDAHRDSPTGAAKGGLLKWFDLDKSLGPLHVARLGIGYDEGKLGLMLDSDVDLAGLSVGLTGFGLHFALDAPSVPDLSLDGLALAYSGGPVTISGAFLKGESVTAEQTDPSYDGVARIAAWSFSITGFGSYTTIEHQPSLFIYAALIAELGGPPGFRVRGLAAGFGYNRRLKLPAITEVDKFPFIKALASPTGASGGGKAGELQAELKALASYVTPAHGEYWLAAGIKFNAFELVEAVALLSVSFGQDVEIGVLGLAQMRLPRGVGEGREIAFAELALRAAIKPEAGTIFVEGRLTDTSFILSRDCRLQGGFALMFWFSGPHEGDFVITLGGYHPTFRKPDHYPDVPRIGLHWEVTRELTITAEMYFALTPVCVMAGGRLSAIYTSKAIKAWFIAHADFLLNWEPLHYTAEMGVTIGFEVDLGLGTLRASRGVDLSLWGPAFGGKVTLDLTLFTIEIAFGAPHVMPAALDAERFEAAFLPEDRSTVLAARIAGGLTGADAGEAPSRFVDVSGLKVMLQTSVPIENYRLGADEPVTPAGLATIGIAPMASEILGSRLELEVTRRTRSGRTEEVPAKHLLIEPQLGNVPAALWRASDAIAIPKKPPASEDMTLAGCIGIAISPAPPERVGALPPMALRHFDTQRLRDKRIPDLPSVSADRVKIFEGGVSGLMSGQVVARRAAVLATLQEISPFPLCEPDLSKLAKRCGEVFSAPPVAPAPLGLVGEA